MRERSGVALVGSFSSRPAAEMAAAMLRSNDVPAGVVGDDAGGTGGINLAAGGYQLEVPDGQRSEAVALLDQVVDTAEDGADDNGSGHSWLFRVVGLLVLVVIVISVLWSVPFF